MGVFLEHFGHALERVVEDDLVDVTFGDGGEGNLDEVLRGVLRSDTAVCVDVGGGEGTGKVLVYTVFMDAPEGVNASVYFVFIVIMRKKIGS
jgi:hypothetical protein